MRDNKKKYYALDDFGPIGSQEYRSPAEIKEDYKRTIAFINADKVAQKKKTVSRKRRTKAK